MAVIPKVAVSVFAMHLAVDFLLPWFSVLMAWVKEIDPLKHLRSDSE